MSEQYQLSDVALRNGKNGSPTWLIIKGAVYDVTEFLDDHPGGGELVLEYAGKDATKAFNSAGHSSDAVKDLKKYKIGELVQQQQPKMDSKAAEAAQSNKAPTQEKEEKGSSIFCCC